MTSQRQAMEWLAAQSSGVHLAVTLLMNQPEHLAAVHGVTDAATSKERLMRHIEAHQSREERGNAQPS